MTTAAQGYITDVPYVGTFVAEQAPAWLDHVAVLSGYAPPSRDDGFAWCDLGCGQGITATLLAATHPRGRFVGIDLMPRHVEHARLFAADARAGNVAFHEADFAAACDLDLPRFDYIVAHGVYSWVHRRVQNDLRRFIDRHLKPGGLVYLSYNAMPGRGPDVALQQLLRTFALGRAGDSIARVNAVLPFVRRVAEMKIPALAGSLFDPAHEAGMAALPEAYIAHEFMNEHWNPLFVTEVRSAMAEIGLRPAGSAALMQNHDSFVLGKAARALLAEIEDDDLRELTRDYFLNQCFRQDVFIRDGATLSDEERQDRLFDSTFSLGRPAARIELRTKTQAGQLDFDNPFTRDIVAGLASGPRRLADIVPAGGSRDKYLANLLVLCGARAVRPVEASGVCVQAVNRAIRFRQSAPEAVPYVALAHGTSVRVTPELMQTTEYRDYLRAHGVDGDHLPAIAA